MVSKAHVMIDLETFDVVPGAVIASLGACEFYPGTNIVFHFKAELEDVKGNVRFYKNLEIK